MNSISLLPTDIHVRTLHRCNSNNTKPQVSERKSEIQDGGFENSVEKFSAYTHDSNEISMITPMFPGSDNTYKLYCEYGFMSGHKQCSS